MMRFQVPSRAQSLNHKPIPQVNSLASKLIDGKPADQPKKVARSRTSWFTRGLRRIAKLMQSCLPLPQLWSVILN
jgi:hypothetical protein